jgi:uncharacterized membrane protein YkvA (DUF1232 family)
MSNLWVMLAIALVLYAALVLGLMLAGRRVAAKELVTLVPNLLLLFKDLLKDPSVPRVPKLWLALGTLWLVSPIDLLPEFLPIVGPLDDAVVAALVLRHLVHRAGADVVRRHWRGEPATLDRILRAAGLPTDPP